MDGLEITQFTYFQQAAGFILDPISLEITYGLERLAMFLQKKDNVFDIEWTKGVKYGEIMKQNEKEFSKYNFELAGVELHTKLFELYENEAKRLIKENLCLPAYDYVIKCSHVFNILDSRRSISVSERTSYIARIRNLAKQCSSLYLNFQSGRGDLNP